MNYQDIVFNDTEPNMNELTRKIEDWARERKLDTADPSKQIIKLFEEAGETCEAYLKNKPSDIVDGLGDMYVVMTILCLQLGISVKDCADIALNEIKDRRGVLKDGVFVKEADL